MLYIASDHAGYELKESLLLLFKRMEWDFVDMGPFEYVKDDDYPLYAKKVCEKLLETKGDIGILICDTGVGMYMAANRFKGIRAALLIDEFYAQRAREHNNANVLVFGAEYMDSNKIFELCSKFFNTSFGFEERHLRRINELDNLNG